MMLVDLESFFFMILMSSVMPAGRWPPGHCFFLTLQKVCYKVSIAEAAASPVELGPSRYLTPCWETSDPACSFAASDGPSQSQGSEGPGDHGEG